MEGLDALLLLRSIAAIMALTIAEHQEIFVISVVGGCMLVLTYLQYKPRIASWLEHRRKLPTMTRGQRIHWRKFHVADMITDGMEKLVDKGILTRYEAMLEYRKIGKYMQNADLIPRKLVNKIRFDEKKPDIPGPKPGENVYPSSPIPIVPVKPAIGFGLATAEKFKKSA